jgi:uncharacterized protein (DUF2342 family)
MDTIGDLDPSDPNAMLRLQGLFSDPMVLMGAMRTPEQESLASFLDARVAAIVGYIDYAVDTVAARLLGAASPIAEAVRRRRIESASTTTLIEQLLGLSLSRAQQVRGRAFIEGVVERQGPLALPQLLLAADNLPTPNEIDAPGLWLARLEVQ